MALPIIFAKSNLYILVVFSNMSLGRVDKIGRFVSEFDPEPEKEKKKGICSLKIFE
jgi:hypothetical protein